MFRAKLDRKCPVFYPNPNMIGVNILHILLRYKINPFDEFEEL